MLSHIEDDAASPGFYHPDTRAYSLFLRNGSTTLFDEVVVFYRSTGVSGVVFAGVRGFPAGALEQLPLGPAGRMVDYAVGFFVQGSMVARFPENGGAMTPQMAAARDPNRPDPYTDSWVIVQGTLLPLAGSMYTVAVRNESTDVWDSVSLSFKEKGKTAVILESPAVQPNSTITMELCSCDKMEGYLFSIFVDGSRMRLGPKPGDLQFPLVGTMNARRAFEYKAVRGDTDLDACGDVWVLG